MDENATERVIGVLGNQIAMTWMNISPVTQVYGVLFNKNNKVLVLARPNGVKTLPGGKPEVGENIYQTLERESMEEANVTINNLKLIGANKVSDPQCPDPNMREYYQLRLVGEVVDELGRQVDPATGETMERIYVELDDLNQVLNWGKTGAAMVEMIKKVLSAKI